MQIKTIHSNDPDYADLVQQEASVYNTSAWLQVYGGKCKIMGVYDEQTLVAAFNTFSFKKAVLHFFIPPPYMPDCALIISDKANKNEVVDCIVSWLQLQSHKQHYAQFIFNVSYKYSGLFERHTFPSFEQKKKHTYVLDLSNTDDVQNLYAPKRRQQIRRALKDGLKAEQLNDLRSVYPLILQTFQRQGKTIDEKLVKKILSDPQLSENSFAFAAMKDGEPIVAYFCIYHTTEAYYLLGGYNENEKHIGAGPLAMSACIEHAKKLGIELFDFEGSMEPSIEKYFKEFGGTKKQYLSFERAGTLGKVALKLKKLIKG